MTGDVVLRVVGLPAPKGDKSAVLIGGRARLVEGKRGAQRAKLTAWGDAVRDAAARWLDEHPQQPLTGPLSIDLVFRFPQTKSAPDRHFHVVTPDFDKIMRSTGDALKHAGLIADDSLFCRGSFEKRYVEGDENIGCSIRLRSLALVEYEHSQRRKAARRGKPAPNAETLL